MDLFDIPFRLCLEWACPRTFGLILTPTLNLVLNFAPNHPRSSFGYPISILTFKRHFWFSVWKPRVQTRSPCSHQGSKDCQVRKPTAPNWSQIFKFCWPGYGPVRDFQFLIGPGFAPMFQIFTGPDDRDRIRTPDRELEFSIFENLILVEKVNLKGRFGPWIPGSFVTNLQTRPSYCSLHFGPDSIFWSRDCSFLDRKNHVIYFLHW